MKTDWLLGQASGDDDGGLSGEALTRPAIATTLLTETGAGSAWRPFLAELRLLRDEGT